MTDYTKDKGYNESDTIHKIRISLTARNVKALEKVCADLVQGAKDKRLRCKGPVRMPTKKLVSMHASASPFEAFAERNNWMEVPIAEDRFAARLLAENIPLDAIKAWSVDPQVIIEEG